MAKVSYFFDERGKKPALKIALQHAGSRVNISLDIHVNSNQWDASKSKVVNHADADIINKRAASYMRFAASVVAELDAKGELDRMSATAVKNAILSRITPEQTSDRTLLKVLFEEYKKRVTPSTAGIFDITWKNLNRYDKKVEYMHVDDINYLWLDNYRLWLSENGSVSVNTQAIRLSNLRTICNYAWKTDAAHTQPFKNFAIRIGEIKHRNVSVETLRKILFFPFKANGPSERWQDYAKLMFLFIGINVSDMWCLTQDNITEDGYLEYTRLKTKKKYRIKIEPEAWEILEKHKGETKLLRLCETMNRHNFGICFNSALKNIGPQNKPIFPKMSTYWLRHSWATIGSSLGYPMEIIARSLGHSWARETETYVTFDNGKIDNANRAIIDWVWYNKK